VLALAKENSEVKRRLEDAPACPERRHKGPPGGAA
jgi:hypothetical protein